MIPYPSPDDRAKHAFHRIEAFEHLLPPPLLPRRFAFFLSLTDQYDKPSTIVESQGNMLELNKDRNKITYKVGG